MIILPAIDLIGGKCVRLKQGRYDDVTIYNRRVVLDGKRSGGFYDSDDFRMAMAAKFENKLRKGEVVYYEIVGFQGPNGAPIMSQVDNNKVKDPEFTRKAIERFGDKVAIGIDAHSGFVSVDGWTSDSELKAVDFALKCKEIGAKTVVFTDIARDGMLTGPAVEATREMVEATGLDVIASGGIGSNEDVTLIKTSGCAGVIIGKAIYEGKVDLAKCLQNV